MQRLKLVRRPTERDIFWDETTGESLDPSCLLDPKPLPHLSEERQCNRPKQQLCSGEDGIQRARAQGPTIGNRGLSLDKNPSWTADRETVRIEDMGKTQRDSWLWPESARSCQTARRRGARGIWDYKLD